MDNKRWTLYRHTSPSGKVYIGITSKYPVYKKWSIQYDLSMNKVAEYQSISLASKITGEHLSHISECCRGKIKRVKQYIWRFKDGI